MRHGAPPSILPVILAALICGPGAARAADPLDDLDGTEAWSRVGSGVDRPTREEARRRRMLRALSDWEGLQEAWETERLELRNERRHLEEALRTRKKSYVEHGVDIIVRDETAGAPVRSPQAVRPVSTPAPAAGTTPNPAPRAAPSPTPRAAPSTGVGSSAGATADVPDWMAEEARRLEQRAGGWIEEDGASERDAARQQAEAESRARAEAEARARAQEEARRREAARLQAEEAARRRAEAEETARLEAERRAAEAAIAAERARLEELARQQELERQRAEEEARRRAEEEARLAEERRKAEEAARLAAEAEARRRKEAAREQAERIGGRLDSEGQFVDPDLEEEFEDLDDDDF